MLLALGFIDSPEEILLVLAILVLLFGPSKLPQLGSSLGKSMRAFKEGAKGESEKAGEPEVKGAQVAEASILCPSCGASVGAASEFCTRCGAKLT